MILTAERGAVRVRSLSEKMDEKELRRLWDEIGRAALKLEMALREVEKREKYEQKRLI